MWGYSTVGRHAAHRFWGPTSEQVIPPTASDQLPVPIWRRLPDRWQLDLHHAGDLGFEEPSLYVLTMIHEVVLLPKLTASTAKAKQHSKATTFLASKPTSEVLSAKKLRIPRNMACIWSIVSDCSEVQLNGNC